MRLNDLLHSEIFVLEDGRAGALYARQDAAMVDFVAPRLPEIRVDSGEDSIRGQWLGLGWEAVGSGVVVRVDGDLVPSVREAYDQQCVGYEELRQVLEYFGESRQFEWILLAAHCYGGTVSGAGTFHDWMSANADRYNIHGYVNEIASSGGYWILSSAVSIGASRRGRTASIAAYSNHMYALEPEIGVEEFKSGEMKRYGSAHPYRPLNDDERRYRQAKIDKDGADFAGDVAKGRTGKITLEAVLDLKGATLSTEEALDIGLVDRLCSLDQMIKSLEIQAMDKKLLDMLKAQDEAEATTKIEGLLQASSRLDMFETNAKAIAGEADPSKLLAKFSGLQQNNTVLESEKAVLTGALAVTRDELTKAHGETRKAHIEMVKLQYADRLNPDRVKVLDQLAASGANLETVKTYAEALSVIAPSTQFQTPPPPNAPAGADEGEASGVVKIEDVPKDIVKMYRSNGLTDAEIVGVYVESRKIFRK